MATQSPNQSPDAARSRVLSRAGTRLLLDGKPFWWQGLSFFNALFNEAFMHSTVVRRGYLSQLHDNGINALRVWCQWNFGPPHHVFVDLVPDGALFDDAGEIRPKYFERLQALIEDANALQMVIELVLFSHEKQPNLPATIQERATRNVAQALRPYRNLMLQIWNEDSTNVARCYEIIKAADANRLVTNSPGFAGNLGDDAQNQLLDVLTPHTSRDAQNFSTKAPQQIAMLLKKFGKPVIDDEPARTGTAQFGGTPTSTPQQHIEQIRRVRAAGGYHTYHHDMFQRPSGHPSIPPEGWPNPDFSPFHRQVFDYLRDHKQW